MPPLPLPLFWPSAGLVSTTGAPLRVCRRRHRRRPTNNRASASSAAQVLPTAMPAIAPPERPPPLSAAGSGASAGMTGTPCRTSSAVLRSAAEGGAVMRDEHTQPQRRLVAAWPVHPISTPGIPRGPAQVQRRISVAGRALEARHAAVDAVAPQGGPLNGAAVRVRLAGGVGLLRQCGVSSRAGQGSISAPGRHGCVVANLSKRAAAAQPALRRQAALASSVARSRHE